MSSTKSGPKKGYPVWPDPCTADRNGQECNGKIISKGHYGFEKQLNGLIDPRRKYRIWTCQSCGKEYREPKYKALYDPEQPQPMVSEYTQRMSKDPARAS